MYGRDYVYRQAFFLAFISGGKVEVLYPEGVVSRSQKREVDYIVLIFSPILIISVYLVQESVVRIIQIIYNRELDAEY